MNVAIIGAGVSGLTCGVLFAERRFRTAIFAKEIGQQTTSGAAGAIWFPYDAKPAEKVIPWSLATYETLIDLSRDSRTGVLMIEVRQFSRTGDIEIPQWAISLGAGPLPLSVIPSEVEGSLNQGPITQITWRDQSLLARSFAPLRTTRELSVARYFAAPTENLRFRSCCFGFLDVAGAIVKE